MNHTYIDNNSDKLIIVFSSIPERNKGMNDNEYAVKARTTLTFYNLMRKNNYFGANILWIPDDFSESGGWYVSDFGIPIFEYLKNFIENFIEIKGFDSKNVYTLGSSRGGFASLLYGNVCKNVNNIISFVPQSNVKKHGWLKYLKGHDVKELSLSFEDIENMKIKDKNRKLFLTKPEYNEKEYGIFSNDKNVYIMKGKHGYYSEIINNILKDYFKKVNIIEEKEMIKDYSRLFKLNESNYSIEKNTVSNFRKIEKKDGVFLKSGEYMIEIELEESDNLILMEFNLNGERIGQYKFNKKEIYNRFTLKSDVIIWPTIKRMNKEKKYIVNNFKLWKIKKQICSYSHEFNTDLLKKEEIVEFNGLKIKFKKLQKIGKLPRIKIEQIENKTYRDLLFNIVDENEIGRTELLKLRTLSWCKNIDDICSGIHFLKMYKREILDEFCAYRGRSNILLNYIEELKIKGDLYYEAALIIINNDINKMMTRKKTYYNHDIMMYRTFFNLLNHKNINYLQELNKKEIKKYLLNSYHEFSNLIINEYGLIVENTPSYNVMVPEWMREIENSDKLKLNLKTRSFFNVKDIKYFFNFGDSDFQSDEYFGQDLLSYIPQQNIETMGQFIKYENENIQLIAKAYTLSTAHQHQDDLSFQLAWNGKFIFIDPGKFKYEYQDERRKFIISRLAHNTISINNICCSTIENYKVQYLNNLHKKRYFKKYLKPKIMEKSFELYDDKYGHKIERNFSEFSDDSFEMIDTINQSIN